MLDLYKLEVFVHVAEEGSFSKAAVLLHMSQPAVSQHILALEQGFGTALFSRSRQGVVLTQAGRTLLNYADSILRLAADAVLAVTDVRNLAGGQIVVGATPGVSAYLLPDWVQSYRQHYPKLTVMLNTGITREIIDGILGRTLALGVIEGEVEDVDQRLGFAELQEVDQLVVVGPQHPWWGREQVRIEALDRQPMVTRQAGSQTRIWLDGALEQYGVEPSLIAELDNLESIKRLVRKGVALTVLPAYVVRDEVSHGQLQTIAIEGRPLRRTLKLLWNRAAPFSPLARSFLQHLASVFPQVKSVFQ